MLTKVEALALLGDLPEGGISAADMRSIVEAVFDYGISDIEVLSNRIQGATEISEAVLGTVIPWDATGSYTGGDTVLDGGKVFMALKAIAAGGAHPVSGQEWAILDYKGQYATLTDLEIKAGGRDGIIGGHVERWTAKDFHSPDIVEHGGKFYQASAHCLPTYVPGSANTWHELSLVELKDELKKTGDVVMHMTLGNHALGAKITDLETRVAALEGGHS